MTAHTRSTIIAAASPPPIQMAAMPRFRFCVCNRQRQPELPGGTPKFRFDDLTRLANAIV